MCLLWCLEWPHYEGVTQYYWLHRMQVTQSQTPVPSPSITSRLGLLKTAIVTLVICNYFHAYKSQCVWSGLALALTLGHDGKNDNERINCATISIDSNGQKTSSFIPFEFFNSALHCIGREIITIL